MSAKRIAEIFERASQKADDLNPAEKIFDAVGLGRGTYAPAGRMIVGGAAGWAVMELVKPDFAYTADGSARPWSFSQGGADNPELATAVPWWVGPAAGAFICGTFI